MRETIQQNLWTGLTAKRSYGKKPEGSHLPPLPLGEREYGPFDTDTINKILSPLNLFYGTGYAHSLKPIFFLARIRDTRYLDKIPIMVLYIIQNLDIYLDNPPEINYIQTG